MGLRFQRRIKVLPGVHLNLSLSGVGVSVGGRGAHVGLTARGRNSASVGLPGTGLSWREYSKPTTRQNRCELCAPGQLHFPEWLAVLIVLLVVIIVVMAAANSK